MKKAKGSKEKLWSIYLQIHMKHEFTKKVVEKMKKHTESSIEISSR